MSDISWSAKHKKIPRRLSAACEVIIKCAAVTIKQLCILYDNDFRANFIQTRHIASEATSSTLRPNTVTGVNSVVVKLHVLQERIT
jgi:dTDP-4-dehydrorhamnose reductase